ncbi:MAG: sulfite exporter TauE/SafE family protein [Boseongicola sp.]|nr:sulfite exporter TauE/SafE family protein [Boseongicola sp.]MDD9978788.1 sulfite exporter TauE/SafE family protein [Boseongicola sp.]
MTFTIFAEIGTVALMFSVALAVFAGFVKGTVGFALPMIMVSGLGSFLSPELTLAGLIISAVFTNVWQALRTGVANVVLSVRAHWRYLTILFIFLVGAAQLFPHLPEYVLFLCLGVPVVFFASLQLLGWQLQIGQSNRRTAELGVGSLAGVLGGLSGIWGPPTVIYLTALNLPKDEQMRVQGIIYGFGAFVLLVAHLRSGILNASTIPFSAFLLVPSLIGLAIGFAVQERMSQDAFRKATLVVLIIGGLNLIRRGLIG